MDSEYRKALREHFKESFKTNQIHFKKQSPAIDFVESLLPAKRIKEPLLSRTVDALLDGTYASSILVLSKRYQHGKSGLTSSGRFPRYIHRSYTGSSIRRETGGEDIVNPSRYTGSSLTLNTITSSRRSSSTSFRPRTSRDLLSMVRSQCRVVESQHQMAVDSSVCQSRHPPKVLWKSRRKFDPSEEMPSGQVYTSQTSSISNLRLLNERIVGSGNQMPSRNNTEKLVRDQFTAPLTREIERIYVQNILTTADLLKKLDTMPSAIVEALDKLQN